MWTVFALALTLAQNPSGAWSAGSRADQLAHIDSLVQNNATETLPQLIKLLGHPLHDVRLAALLGLAGLGAAEAVTTALTWLKSPDLQPRLDALAALADSACPFPEQAAEATLAMLADARAELRLPALKLLHDRLVVVPSSTLALLAEDEDAAVRAAALAAVGPRQDAAARYALVGRLGDADVAVRWQAIAAMGRSRDPALRPVLEHVVDMGDATWAAAAVEALGALGDRAATSRLAALVQAPGPATKLTRAAIVALADLGGPEAAYALALRLHLQGVQDSAFESTVSALRQLGADAEKALLPLISSDTPGSLLLSLVEVMGNVGSSDCVPALAALLGQTSAAVPATLTALANLADRGVDLTPAHPALRRAGKDPSQTVRRLAHALTNRFTGLSDHGH